MNLVSIEDVKNGMVLARDVINDLGIIFMSAGSELNPSSIEGLRKLDIDFIYVEDEINSSQMPSPEQVSVEQAYIRLIKVYKSIYANVGLGKSLNLEQLAMEVLPLFRKITADNNILNCLRRISVKEPYIYVHSVNVAIFSMIIGRWLNLKAYIQDDLALTGFLHDIGKTKVAYNIIEKPSELTLSEYEKAKEHSRYGSDILGISTGVKKEIIDGVKYHHERIDGSGYPEGLQDRQISLYAKIVAVADVFDAITISLTSQKFLYMKPLEYLRRRALISWNRRLQKCF